MATIHLDNTNDSRLAGYLDLKTRELAAADPGRFLAEGRLVVERLLAGTHEVESVLIEQRRLAEMEPLVAGRAPLYVVPNPAMEQVTGYKIHTGILAIGRRPAQPDLDAMMPPQPQRAFWLVAPIIKELANLGALVRTATAFGVTGLMLGPHCCDPYYRRALRVSMGTLFRLPIFQSQDLQRDLLRLRDDHGVTLCATVLEDGAERLHDAPAEPRMAVMLGHEYLGLHEHWVGLCRRKITIPMHLGTDSLNVSVSAALFCYHFLAPKAPVRLPEAESQASAQAAP